MEHSELKLEAEKRGLGLQVSSDDFSMRVTHPDIPLFWIRLEHGNYGAFISDFSRASLTPTEMSIALSVLLEAAGMIRPPQLQFKNVTHPKADIDAEYRAILGQFAKRTGRFLKKLEQVQQNGKLDVIAEFSP